MEIKEPKYLGSFPNLETCPSSKMPEYAFIGRSNVGKSSLINMLCRRKSIAHVSKKPGKTMAINIYAVDNAWQLVDLPGYGFAVRSKSMLRKFEHIIYGYLERRSNLVCAFVLIDVNVPPQKNDIEFLGWLGIKQVPFTIVYTKTDRMQKHKLQENVEAIQQAFLEQWSELPPQFFTSAEKGEGREAILEYIESLNLALATGKH